MKTLEIEFETGLELVREYAIPAIEGQLGQSYALLSAVKSEALKGSLGKRVALLEDCYHQILKGVDALSACFIKLHSFETEEEKVAFLAKDIKSTYAELRKAVDKVEQVVGDEHWKLPKYREMLFHSSLR